jgi:hypothetical protein
LPVKEIPPAIEKRLRKSNAPTPWLQEEVEALRALFSFKRLSAHR